MRVFFFSLLRNACVFDREEKDNDFLTPANLLAGRISAATPGRPILAGQVAWLHGCILHTLQLRYFAWEATSAQSISAPVCVLVKVSFVRNVCTGGCVSSTSAWFHLILS